MSFQPDFSLSSQSAELMSLDTGAILFQKSPDKRMEPASLTKIMTFIVVSEHVKDLNNTQITVKKEVLDKLLGTGSSMSGLKDGDVLTAYQLACCMLIRSGNDAAMVLADYVGQGNTNAFVDKMNREAARLGCKNTHFANPDGLHDPNHYTSASDLMKIAEYAMKLPYFKEITAKEVCTYKPVGGPESGHKRTLWTTNLLIVSRTDNPYYYRYANGTKTGHTDESGYCLVSTASADGYNYLCVVLGAPSVDKNGKEIKQRGEMTDSRNLLKWALNSFEWKEILQKDEPSGEVNLNFAWKKDKLLLIFNQKYIAVLPKNISFDNIVITRNIPKSVDAPVRKGQKIGTATLSYKNQQLVTVELVASESVEQSALLKTVGIVKSIFTSVWFIAITSVILVLTALYTILFLYTNQKRRKRKLKKVKKYKRF
jgi:D-alanyl-D-alanine carboxypeptidase (penicillin-binding protein 5/6)